MKSIITLTIQKQICSILFLLILFFSSITMAQVSIGNSSVSNSNALLSPSADIEKQVQQTLKENAQTLRFMENKGQIADRNVLYYFEGKNGSAYIDHDKIRFVANELSDDGHSLLGTHTFTLSLLGSNHDAKMQLGESFATKYNFFLGSTANDNVTGVNAAKDLTLQNIYPGIDLRLYSSADGSLEFDWIMNAGADFSKVNLHFEGQDNLSIDDDGSLKVGLRFADVKLNIPESYQVTSNGKTRVNISFAKTDENTIAFTANSKIDSKYPLVIDPVLSWGTWFDGNLSGFDDYLFAIQVDSVDGKVYCAGETKNVIPTASAPYDAAGGYLTSVNNLNSGTGVDLSKAVAIIYRISANGSDLEAMTLYGPSDIGTTSTNQVSAYALALSSKRVFVGGFTNVSIPFPTLASHQTRPFDSTQSSSDGYVAVFSRNLDTLKYATYLGGSGDDARGVTSIRTVDDNTFVVGLTAAASLPISAPNYISGAAQSSFGGGSDMYIAKFTSLRTLAWGTYAGGTGNDVLNDLHILPNGNISFCGYTSGSFPETNNAAASGSGEDGVIGVLNPTTPSFVYKDQIGGSNNDRINAVEYVGDTLYWTGSAGSGFPVSASNVFSSTFYGGTTDAIVGKVSASGGNGTNNSGGYKATYFGTNTGGGGNPTPTGNDLGNGIKLVTQKSCDGLTTNTFLLVFGTTGGFNLPVLNINGETFYRSQYQNGGNTGLDMFFAGFTSDLKTQKFGTYMGGTADDYLGVTGDPRGANHLWVNGANVYLGTTSHSQTHLPTLVSGGFDTGKSNGTDDTHLILGIQFASILVSDYGDAPASYGTPAHILDNCSKLHIGLLVDNEAGSLPTTDANGDDIGGTDDEDGIGTLPVLTDGTGQTISVTVNNITNTFGSAATLYGWIDLNGDGTFSSSELASVTVANNSTNVSKTLTWSGVTVGGNAGNHYLRIRLTTNDLSGSNGSTAQASNGEIEDYRCVSLTCPGSRTILPCQTQAYVDTAYSNWLAKAKAGGGFGGSLTNNSPGTPLVTAPGTYTVTFTYTFNCASSVPCSPSPQTCASTFTIQPASNIVITPTITTAIKCNGGSATVHIAATGGTLPYIGIGDFSQAAGGHTYVVTDANGCSNSVLVTVTQPDPLTCTVTKNSDAKCNGDHNGSATVNPVGGNGGNTYSWDDGETTATASALNAGSHNVTVTDSKGCTTSCSVLIGQPAVLTCTVTKNSDAKCNGDHNGSATVNPVGGNGGNTYSWDDGETTATATGLSATTHNVTVTDSKGCTTSCSVLIGQPAVLTCTVTKNSDAKCNGDHNGSATVNPVGGNGGNTYSWDDGETTATASALNAGSHSVTVTDSKGCSTSCSVEIGQPDPLTCSADKNSDAKCNGDYNGSATVTPTGGNGGNTYAWDDGETTATASALNAGSHSVTVTDSKGCTTSCSVLIGQPDPLTCSADKNSDAKCNGDYNGSATVTTTGGNGGNAYAWDDGETTATASALNAGSHSVTVTDSKGCTTSCSVLIGQPNPLTCSADKNNDAKCNGDYNGSATVTPTGGNGGNTYAWDDGETTATASALNAGSHSVTVTDSKGCTTSCSVLIGQPDPLTCSADKNNDAKCNGDYNGSATVTPTGGNGDNAYAWDNGETTATASALNAGSHSVTVTDSKGCSTSCSVEIGQPDPLTCSADKNSDAKCNGDYNGSATVTTTGGNGGNTYAWDDGETTATASALNAGSHSVTVTDSKGCTTSCSVLIGQPDPLTCSADKNNDAKCNGDYNGSATVTPTGGNGGNTYAWDDGETTATASALNAGSHSVTVTDSKGCTTSCSVLIGQPNPLTCSADKNNDAKCNGDYNGSATVTPTGGNGGNTYAWDDGETTATASALNAGSHSVTVTDSKGCSTSCSVEIGQPDPLTCSADKNSDAKCNGDYNGSATVTPTGGNGGNTYAWDDGETTATASALNAGSHSVTVTDSKGCSTSCSVEIGQPDPLTCSADKNSDAKCNGDYNGSATVTPTGGNGGNTYAWDDGETTATASALNAGSHSVTVTDSKGCTTSCSVLIGQPNPLTCSADKNNDAKCNGDYNGSATVTPTGGNGGNTYAWDDGETTATASALNAGSHSVTVTDSKGCSTSCSVEIGQPDPLTCSAEQKSSVKCHDESNGSATVTPAGGNGNYTYAWDNGETTATATSLNGGLHNVTVTDGKGCTTSCSVTIDNPDALSIGETHVDVTVNGGSNGSIDLTVTGGTSPYTYLWDDANTDEDRSGLTAGTYCVVVTDAHGCTASKCVEIKEPNCHCAPPANITFTSIGNDQVQVCWDAQECATGYILQYQWKGHTNWVTVNVSAPDHCTIIDLKGHVKIYVKVATICSDGSTTDYSDVMVYNYTAPCVIPTNLSTTNITSTSAKFNWTPGTATSSQKVRYQIVGQSASIVKNVSKTATNYTATGLLPSTNYKWKVKGDCWSDYVKFKTAAQKLEELATAKDEMSAIVYPNPTTDQLSIDITLNETQDTPVTIQFINIVGQVMLSNQDVILDGHGIINLYLGKEISSGVYILKVISGDQSIEKRVVVSK